MRCITGYTSLFENRRRGKKGGDRTMREFANYAGKLGLNEEVYAWIGQTFGKSLQEMKEEVAKRGLRVLDQYPPEVFVHAVYKYTSLRRDDVRLNNSITVNDWADPFLRNMNIGTLGFVDAWYRSIELWRRVYPLTNFIGAIERYNNPKGQFRKELSYVVRKIWKEDNWHAAAHLVNCCFATGSDGGLKAMANSDLMYNTLLLRTAFRLVGEFRNYPMGRREAPRAWKALGFIPGGRGLAVRCKLTPILEGVKDFLSQEPSEDIRVLDDAYNALGVISEKGRALQRKEIGLDALVAEIGGNLPIMLSAVEMLLPVDGPKFAAQIDDFVNGMTDAHCEGELTAEELVENMRLFLGQLQGTPQEP